MITLTGSQLTLLLISIVTVILVLKIFRYMSGTHGRGFRERTLGGVGLRAAAIDRFETIPMTVPIESGMIRTPVTSYQTSELSDEISSVKSFTIPQQSTFVEQVPSTWSIGAVKCADICKSLLPNEHVVYDFRCESIKNPDTERALEIDIFYPALSLGIEFNGKQHYEDTTFGSYTSQAYRDHNKATIAQSLGIVLVQVPYTQSEFVTRATITRILEEINYVGVTKTAPQTEQDSTARTDNRTTAQKAADAALVRLRQLC